MSDLFDSIIPLNPPQEVMAEGAMLLRCAALPFEADILPAIQAITAGSPFRHMVMPGGFVMSVAMTNCSAAGWVTDRSGYRYDALDPESGQPWLRCRPASSISRSPQRRRRDTRTSCLTPA
jgi:alkylated DNA repair protein (DNA oxidative demethylase)